MTFLPPASVATPAPNRTVDRPVPSGPLALLAIVAALLVAVWHVSLLWPYVSDDSFISLRYAERLVAGKGLTWNDGEWVEGYSNLLWVLATAGLLQMGLEGLLALRLLGAACTAITITLVAVAWRPRKVAEIPAAFAAPLLLAASPPVAAWACGGLEGPLLLLLGCWAVMALLPLFATQPAARGRSLLAGLPLALMCLTRPDALLWVGATGLVATILWWRSGGLPFAMARLAALACLPLTLVAAHLAFRIGYYGDYVPNTAHIKATMSPSSLRAGMDYFAGACVGLGALLAPALLGLVLGMRAASRRPTMVLAIPILAFFPFLVAIGGDYLLAWRMFFLVMAPLVWLAAFGLRHLSARGTRGLVIALLIAFGAPWLYGSDSRATAIREDPWEWIGKAQAELLGHAFATAQPLLAVDAAGVLPYYSGLPCLDMLGLNDRTIARTAPVVEPATPRFLPGHTHGNGPYVLSRRPDLVQFGGPPGSPAPPFVSGRWLEADPGFRRDYRCVHLEVPTPWPPDWSIRPVRGQLWVRLSGRVGVQQTPARIDVPAFLFGSLRLTASLQNVSQALEERGPGLSALQAAAAWLEQRNTAVPGERGIDLELRDHATAALDDLPLAAGRWRAQVVPAAAVVEVTLRDRQGRELPRVGPLWSWSGGALSLEVIVPAGTPLPQHLTTVVLTAE